MSESDVKPASNSDEKFLFIQKNLKYTNEQVIFFRIYEKKWDNH